MHAFLAFNSAFEVVFSAEWMLDRHERDLLAAFPGYREYHRPGRGPRWWDSSGSLWLRRDQPAAARS